MKQLLVFALLFFSIIATAQPGTNDFSFNTYDDGTYGDGPSNSVMTTAIQSDGKIIICGAFTSYNLKARRFIARLNADGSLDASFNPGSGANDGVFSIAIQSDGKIIIGGAFVSFNGTTINKIARLNADGSLDASFNPGTGADNDIQTTAIQPDGKIIIGGNFTSFNGTVRNKIARLNTDGSLDASFNPGTGADNHILTTVIQPDGKILIGGYFTNYNGTVKNFITRLNANGSLDASFNPGTGADNTVATIAIQLDGKILIGGNFNKYNGTVKNFITRLNANGSLDASFNPGTGANNTVTTIAIQLDGKILIGGIFDKYNGTVRKCFARLNADGSLDTSFNTGTISNGYVESSAIQADGKIIIVGGFTSFNGTTRNRIVRLNADGSLDASFNIGIGADYAIRSTVIQPDGKIIIGGGFTYYNDIKRNFITRLNADGSLDLSFNPGKGSNNEVHTTAIQSDGKIIIGAYFTSFNGTLIKRIARLNTDGSLDASFNSGLGTNSEVATIAIQSDGKIIIVGYFTSYNGKSRNFIARLNADGSLDETFDPGTGADNLVYTTAIQSDGKIIIGGYFTSFNGTIIKRIARLNADGSLDASFNPGTGANQFVRTSAIQTDGKIIVGGWFTSFNGTTRNHIARLNADGSLDASFNPGLGANNDVESIVIQPDGKIIIGGTFTSFNGTSRNYIARLNADGSLDASFNPGSGSNDRVVSLAIQSDGKIIIGGAFSSFNSTSSKCIARLNADGSLDATFNPGIGASNVVRSIVIQPDGKIIIGGAFTSYNGIPRHRIARLLNNCFTNAGTDTRTACNTYTWINGITYTSSNNTAKYTLINKAGCDSMVTLNLTIKKVSDITTTLYGSTIAANNVGATYQWLDCSSNNSKISGETSQSFIAAMNGSYSVEITENGCVDTSSCVNITSLGIIENNFGSAFTIYPNPTKSDFSIDLGSAYENTEVLIMDISGNLIQSKNISQSKILNLSIKEPTGIYFILIKSGDKKATIRLMKE